MSMKVTSSRPRGRPQRDILNRRLTSKASSLITSIIAIWLSCQAMSRKICPRKKYTPPRLTAGGKDPGSTFLPIRDSQQIRSTRAASSKLIGTFSKLSTYSKTQKKKSGLIKKLCFAAPGNEDSSSAGEKSQDLRSSNSSGKAQVSNLVPSSSPSTSTQ